jgi:hypothetical protein
MPLTLLFEEARHSENRYAPTDRRPRLTSFGGGICHFD